MILFALSAAGCAPSKGGRFRDAKEYMGGQSGIGATGGGSSSSSPATAGAQGRSTGPGMNMGGMAGASTATGPSGGTGGMTTTKMAPNGGNGGTTATTMPQGGAGGQIPPTKPALTGEALNCADPKALEADIVAHFEDGFASTVATGDRTPLANINVFDDGTTGIKEIGVATLAEARCDSTKALRTKGSGFEAWGVVLEIPLRGGSPIPESDASGYAGVRFYAKATADTQLRLKLPDKNTAKWGGVCDRHKGECDDHWGRRLVVKTQWRKFEVFFDDLDLLKVERFGPLATDKLYGIEFIFARGQNYDVLIDDLSLIPR